MSLLKTLILLAALAALAPGCKTASRAALAAQSLTDGDAALERHDYRQAQSHYDTAWRLARRNRAGDDIARAAVGRARALEGLFREQVLIGERRPGAGVPTTQQVYSAFQEAIQQNQMQQPEQASAAQSQIGGVLLKGNDVTGAVKSLSQVRPEMLPEDERFVHYYNYARALELSGEVQRALENYRRAVQLRPSFAPAHEGAFSAVRQAASRTGAGNVVEETLGVARGALAAGFAQLAIREIKLFLSSARGDNREVRVVAVLAAAYARARTTPESFMDTEWPRLELIARANKAPVRDALSDLRAAFAGDWQPVFSAEKARSTFNAWIAPSLAPELSQLLEAIGDYHDSQDKPERALAYYSMAASLWSGNTRAALSTAGLVLANPAYAQGQRFDEFVNLMLDHKSAAGMPEIKTKEQWLSLMRVHIVLGEAFEQRNQLAGGDRRNALNQYLDAAYDEQMVVQLDSSRSYLPSPDLQFRLARIHERLNRPAQAARHYLDAAEGYLEQRAWAEADTAVKRVTSFTTTLPDQDRAKLQTILQTLGTPTTGPSTRAASLP